MDRVVCLLRELSIVISLLNHGSSCTSPEAVGYSDQSAETMDRVVCLLRQLGIVISLLK